MDAGQPSSSNCLLLQNVDSKKYYIIAKSAASRKTVVVRVNQETGELSFANAQGKDVFKDEDEALQHLKKGGCQFEAIGTGKAILGYVVVGPVGLLLIAEKVRVSAVLPGGHEVKTVTTSKWHRITLQQPEVDPAARTAREEFDRGMEKITGFQIDGVHYYCETLDVTRPFPSDRPVTQPSWEFTWNRWLSHSFRHTGLDFICPPLLQGLAEARELEDFDGRKFNIALLSRKGRLHVGPRYKARGLNQCSEPGNEIECEQVVWRAAVKPGGPIAWSRYAWRRGSVPIWWTVSLRNSGIGEAEIKIRHHQTFKGSRRYIRRLQKRYMPNPHLDPDPPEPPRGDTPRPDPSLQVPTALVSLLRKGTPDRDRSEAKLASAYDFVVNQLKREHGMPLTYIALDWHEMDKQLGTEAIVEAFWATLHSVLPAHGFALGTLTKVGVEQEPEDWVVVPTSEGTEERCTSAAGRGWQARWFRQQRGVTRYNCADSLDRTNVASFFGAVQVLVEQCRELDIAIVASSKGAASLARQILARKQGIPLSVPKPPAAPSSKGLMKLEKIGKELNKSLGTFMKSPNRSPRDRDSSSGTPSRSNSFTSPDNLPLPLGWEAKYDAPTKRIFYVDHNTKTTTWERPPPPPGAAPPTTDPFSDGPPSSPEPLAPPTATPPERDDVSYEPLTPWRLMDSTVRAFGRRVAPEALNVMAELFLVNGDLSARLYTGSPAMHSDKILIFEHETSKLRKAGAGVYGNSLIAIQRRYNNVVMDTDKQQQLEIFLGMRPAAYFTALPLLYRDESPVPTDYPETDDEDDIVGLIDWPPRESRPLVPLMELSSPGAYGTATTGRSSPQEDTGRPSSTGSQDSQEDAGGLSMGMSSVAVVDSFYADGGEAGGERGGAAGQLAAASNNGGALKGVAGISVKFGFGGSNADSRPSLL